MSESTQDSEHQVLSAKDDGHKRQWGLGRIFLQWEGAKKRINTRTTLITITVCFLITAVIGLFHKQQVVTSGKSPVNMNLAVGQETKIPAYTQAQMKTRVVAQSGKPAVREGLTITRRNLAGKVPPGTMVRARLLSGASNGFVKATLLENVAPFGDLYFSSGTTVVGVAQSSKERLAVSFTKAVLGDGSVVEIHSQACDGADKMPGLTGVNVRGQAVNLAGAVGLNFAGGVAMGMQTRGSQEMTAPPTVKDSLLNGAAVAAIERGRDLSQDMKSEEPLIEIEEGTEFYLLFLGEG